MIIELSLAIILTIVFTVCFLLLNKETNKKEKKMRNEFLTNDVQEIIKVNNLAKEFTERAEQAKAKIIEITLLIEKLRQNDEESLNQNMEDLDRILLTCHSLVHQKDTGMKNIDQLLDNIFSLMPYSEQKDLVKMLLNHSLFDNSCIPKLSEKIEFIKDTEFKNS